jgi:hypothetical protein
VHRSLGQQHQDGGADVATAATSTVSAPPSAARARAEAAGTDTAAEGGTETAAEAGSETRTEWSVMAGVVTADVVAEFAPISAGPPALLVQRTPGMGVEAMGLEAEGTPCSGAPREFPFYMGEWVVHR